ncbi:MAG TPA: DUF3349 domain-containing protein [Actinocrinis sp.]|nr:DUF3349 domain-containing protein [Actinocrinis sp.]
MPLPPVLQTIVDFVRKGYPQGVPQQDYLPLFALLSRRLSDEEINELARELASSTFDAQISATVSLAIERLTNEPPSAEEVERVLGHLRAAGWDVQQEV